ncbi:MAG: cytochrome c oxidase subunit 3 [Candidatus Binataceae bacterium]
MAIDSRASASKLRPLAQVRRVQPRDGGVHGDEVRRPFISNAMLAVVMLIGAEMMLFSGLIGAFLVFRLQAAFWPPPGLPQLPIAVTAFNTFVLLGSAVTMLLAVRAVHQSRQRLLRRWLTVTALLGVAFLSIQGSEWVRLISHGLHLSSGTYGATFYTLIGCHAAHVTAAVIWLLFVLGAALRGRYNARNASGIEIVAVYWYFVCAVWPLLFVLVYLL